MAHSDILVSIITPVYKAEEVIGQTILSVEAQTYGNWEWLMVDDCSPDRCAEIIQEAAAQDSRIRYHRLKKNSGAAVARNAAIAMAKGEYLAFLDSDDLWMPTKLERQLAFMAKNDAAFSFTRIQMTDTEGRTVKTDIPIPETVDYKYLLRHTVIATSTVVVDRRKTGDFTMPLRRGGQDYATWLKLLRTTGRAYGLDECLTSYRTGGPSLSSNKLDSVRQVYTIQTEDEHIGRLPAALNTLCFCFYAFKKHFL